MRSEVGNTSQLVRESDVKEKKPEEESLKLDDTIR